MKTQTQIKEEDRFGSVGADLVSSVSIRAACKQLNLNLSRKTPWFSCGVQHVRLTRHYIIAAALFHSHFTLRTRV